MDLNELRALVEVANAESVKAAATSLGWARATLRRRIDALEARVGQQLLVRDDRGATLTDAGRTVASHARRLLEDASELLRAARGSHEPSGTLHIRVVTGMPPDAHAAFANLARDSMPGLQLQMHLAEDPLDEPLSDFDALLHFGLNGPGDEWHTVPIARVPLHLVASEQYLADNGVPRSLDELRHHRLVAWRCGDENGSVWRDAQGHPFAVEPVLVTPSIFHAHHYAAAGVGICLVPDGGIDTLGVDPGTLVEVLPGSVGGQVTLRLSFRASLRHDRGVRAFWDLCSGLARDGGVEFE